MKFDARVSYLIGTYALTYNSWLSCIDYGIDGRGVVYTVLHTSTRTIDRTRQRVACFREVHRGDYPSNLIKSAIVILLRKESRACLMIEWSCSLTSSGLLLITSGTVSEIRALSKSDTSSSSKRPVALNWNGSTKCRRSIFIPWSLSRLRPK